MPAHARSRARRRPKIVRVSAPEYTIQQPPDYDAVGRKVDLGITQGFPDGRYIVRAIGLDDHLGMTLGELTRIILRTGTDKHDPSREPVGHEEFAGYDYDIQGGPMGIKGGHLVVDPLDPSPTIFGGIARHFFEGARIDRGHSVRVDLLLLYDPRLVVRARKRDPAAKGVRRELSRLLYRFKDRANKAAALVGVVEILR